MGAADGCLRSPCLGLDIGEAHVTVRVFGQRGKPSFAGLLGPRRGVS